MKAKYKLLLVLAIIFSACTDNFEDFNTDQKRPESTNGEALFSNAQKALADQMTTANVNLNIWRLWAQYWTETTYTDEANYDIVNRTIADLTFRTYYRDVLRDMEEAKLIIADEEVFAENTATDVSNKLHIIELLEVYTWQNLVDIFGDIPYTEALDIENLLPVYDDAATIYSDLIARVDAALDGLADSDNPGFGTADLIYGGSVDAWIAFGNSLKIKLGITLADVNASLAESTIESAVAGAFASGADNAMFGFEGSPPNTNQIYAELVLTGRKDFVAANTIIDIMNALEDPRIAAYFEQIDTSTEEGVVKLAYVGGQYGYTSPWSQYSHVEDAMLDPAYPGPILTYDEVLFYLAEAAQRGFDVGGTAEELYNNAVTASFDLWGVSGAAEYLTNPAVAYSDAEWKDRIGTQSWLAFYNRGLEGYTQWRRLDAPAFNIAEAITELSEIPLRFTYPINEQTLNADNYYAASDAIGGDELTTPIFWDTE